MADKDATDEGATDEDAIRAAIMLLLADLPPARQAYLIREACPYLIIRTINSPIGDKIINAFVSAKETLKYNDGTSPLGAAAAKNLHSLQLEVLYDVRAIATVVGVSLPEK